MFGIDQAPSLRTASGDRENRFVLDLALQSVDLRVGGDHPLGQSNVAPLDVLIWIGDNIQDFPNLSQSGPGDFAPFGIHYFTLPNPMYGSWQKVSAR